MNRIKSIGIIPARGGSKGIKKKNLALLKGKPLIEYAIRAGLKCTALDRVIVSTDDPEIADIARNLGAEVPFMRPEALAQDSTPDRPVFLHCVDWLAQNEGYHFDAFVNLRCTTPLKKAEHIEAALQMLEQQECDSVRSVDRIHGKHHPYWVLKADAQGYGVSFIEGIDRRQYHQRQLLPPAFAINAVVDAVKVITLLKYENLYGEKMGLLEIDPIFAIDIDQEKDLILCEAVMEKMDELV
ncbi:MAG: acylneuraminate cytidylyltransferase family protein [Desulfobacteraceae bacterium]|nr:MAG: acylneuraminate cytidylyltransferase family protein [Desulfobacteraceae bacterium]